MRNNQYASPPTRGFTLIELLVVVGVMAVMLSVAAIGIQNIDKGQATVSGLSQTQALMDETRNLAIGRGTRARLCIHADSSEEERNLRYMVIAFEEIERDESGEEIGRSWVVESRGTSLPGGVYFHPQFSQDASSQIDGLGTYGSGGSGVRFPATHAPSVTPLTTTLNSMQKVSASKKDKVTPEQPSFLSLIHI